MHNYANVYQKCWLKVISIINSKSCEIIFLLDWNKLLTLVRELASPAGNSLFYLLVLSPSLPVCRINFWVASCGGGYFASNRNKIRCYIWYDQMKTKTSELHSGFKCRNINISNIAFWAIALERKLAHTEKEKNLLLRWDSKPWPPEQITVALPTELQSQMGGGSGKLRW